MRVFLMSLVILVLSGDMTGPVGASSDPEGHSSEELLAEGVGVQVMGQDRESREIETYAKSVLKSKGIKVARHGNAYLQITRGPFKYAEHAPGGDDGKPYGYETAIEFRASAGGMVHHSVWKIAVTRISVVPPGEHPQLSEIKEDIRHMLTQFTIKYFPRTSR